MQRVRFVLSMKTKIRLEIKACEPCCVACASPQKMFKYIDNQIPRASVSTMLIRESTSEV